MLSNCDPSSLSRRRIFWTTQDSCGVYSLCGEFCSIPGLKYEDSAEGRTINTDNWLQSLILNILNTRARSTGPCLTPTAIYGHWSESFRSDGIYIGSRLWEAASRSYPRISDSVRAINAAIQADVNKLVILSLATQVKVDTQYRSGNQVIVTIAITMKSGSQTINLSGALASGTWVWR